MNRERLLNVARVLEDIPDNRFDLGVWERNDNCGTVCCAVGWYCKSPFANGLKLDEMFGGPVTADQEGSKLYDLDAVEYHFGLDTADSEYLFLPSRNCEPTRQNVINRIRDFVQSRA